MAQITASGAADARMAANKAFELDAVLYNLVESRRILGVLLAPFLTTSSVKILAQLGFERTGSTVWDAKWGNLPA